MVDATDDPLVLSLVEDRADDLMREVVEALLARGEHITPSKGPALDIIGARLELRNPRARLSRTETRGRVFGALGELCWYLSGSNDAAHIKYYLPGYVRSEEDGVIFGGYGPRLFDLDGINQVRYVIDQLSSNPSSRKAVIQLFDAADVVSPHKDVPCTCTLQFLVRRDQLHLVTNMRSNDAHIGLPHDLFCFTMLQELVAASIGVPIGRYIHFVGSMHLYDRDRDEAQTFLREGFQSKFEMPPMPDGDPWASVHHMLDVEGQLREGRPAQDLELSEDQYWGDLERLLAIHQALKKRDGESVDALTAAMASPMYRVFIDDRLDRA